MNTFTLVCLSIAVAVCAAQELTVPSSLTNLPEGMIMTVENETPTENDHFHWPHIHIHFDKCKICTKAAEDLLKFGEGKASAVISDVCGPFKIVCEPILKKVLDLLMKHLNTDKDAGKACHAVHLC